jgi:hypothetical protein
MKAMTLRNVDPKVAETLRRRARARGQSLNALIVELLARAAEDIERRERIQEQAPRRARLRAEITRRFGRVRAPSERLIRADRKR